MSEVFKGEPTPEENPYREIDTWLKGVKPGDPKFQAFSDAIVETEIDAYWDIEDEGSAYFEKREKENVTC